MSVPLLVFPDVVALVVGQLAAQLPALVGGPVHVGNRVPTPRPERFVVVRRAGGDRVTIVTEAATINVAAWAQSVPDADDIAQACRSALHAMGGANVDGVPVYKVVDLGGPAEEADPLSDQPMSQLSVSVHVRGHTP
jgi:hypothetical protein